MADDIIFSQRELEFCCGVEELGQFAFEDDEDYCFDYRRMTSFEYIYPSGTGLYVVCFNQRPESKAAFEQITEHFDLLYKSPVRHNKNSGNDMFVCIFSDKEK